MKRILFAVTFLSAVFSAEAQDNYIPKNEIAVSVGVATHANLSVSFANVLADIFEGNGITNTYTGAYSLSYLYNTNEHIALGVSGTYEYMARKNEDGDKTSETFITVMPTIRAYWFRSNMFGMYSRAGAGASFQMRDYFKNNSTTDAERKCDPHFAFQVSPLCLELGSRKFSGFLELGYGYQGLVHGGFKFGF